MHIQSLNLTHFRNYQELKLTLLKENFLYALIGKNAQGKTNFIEAISILSLAKSFRNTDTEDLLKFDESHFRIQANILNRENQEEKLEVFFEQHPRKRRVYKIDDVNTSTTNFVGHLLSTTFSADDIHMAHAAPSIRRRYFDMILSQIDQQYLRNLLHYQKTIKHRNKLLKRIANKTSKTEELFFWDLECIESGLSIVKKREELIDFYNTMLKDLYHEISRDSQYEISMVYESNLAKLSKEEAQKEMEQRYHRDTATENTSLGPHRDDWYFKVDNKKFSHYGSRGEMRSMALALKMTEREFFYENKGCYPILLLDDVFSELDDIRKQQLIKMLKDQQTFITTTDREWMKGMERKIEVWEVEGGEIHTQKMDVVNS